MVNMCRARIITILLVAPVCLHSVDLTKGKGFLCPLSFFRVKEQPAARVGATEVLNLATRYREALRVAVVKSYKSKRLIRAPSDAPAPTSQTLYNSFQMINPFQLTLGSLQPT